MAKTIHSKATSASAANLSRYATLSGGTGQSNTQAQKQVPIYSAGTFNKLKAFVLTNTADTTVTLALQIAGSNGTCLVSVPTTQTGLFETTTESDAVTTTQLVNFVLTQPAGSGAISVAMSISFAATTNTAQLLIVGTGADFTDDAATVIYLPLVGNGLQETTENNVEFTAKTGGTLRNASWYVSANARTVTSTMRSRVAGANGNLSIAVATTLTGLFQDTSNTDTVVSGNTINWSITSSPAETNNLTGQFAACEFITTDSTWENIVGISTVAGNTIAAATTAYYWIQGTAGNSDTTEANRQIEMSFACTASNMSIYVVTNNATTGGTCALMRNGSASALSASITALTTGLFVDDSNTVAIAVGDTLSTRIVTGATDTTLIGTFGFKMRIVSSSGFLAVFD